MIARRAAWPTPRARSRGAATIAAELVDRGGALLLGGRKRPPLRLGDAVDQRQRVARRRRRWRGRHDLAGPFDRLRGVAHREPEPRTPREPRRPLELAEQVAATRSSTESAAAGPDRAVATSARVRSASHVQGPPSAITVSSVAAPVAVSRRASDACATRSNAYGRTIGTPDATARHAPIESAPSRSATRNRSRAGLWRGAGVQSTRPPASRLGASNMGLHTPSNESAARLAPGAGATGGAGLGRDAICDGAQPDDSMIASASAASANATPRRRVTPTRWSRAACWCMS